jgi:hypothetical protein
MLKQMTSWTLNSLAALVTGAILIFPNPSALFHAVESAVGRDAPAAQISVREATPEAVAYVHTHARSTDEPILIPDRETALCLEATAPLGWDVMRSCIEKLHRDLKQIDTRMAYRPNAAPIPEAEERRLALAQLCRVRWNANGGRWGPETTEACQYLQQPVAY